MVEILAIENFQSHEKVELEFCLGVNTIIGTSNHGKSAILRALYWLVYNKPEGYGFASHWIINKKGNMTGDTEVRLKITDQPWVSRRRSHSFNGYCIGSDELTAIGRDVPVQVSSLLNLLDVNIQKQLDSHYLLSESAGAAARLFNRTIRLDVIDDMLSLVESKKRKTKGGINSIESQIADYEIELDSLSGIERAELYITKAEALEEDLNTSMVELDGLSNSLAEYQDHSELLESIQLDDTDIWLNEIEDLLNENKKQNRLIVQMKASVEDFVEFRSEVNRVESVPDVSAQLNEIEKVYLRVKDFKKELSLIKESLESYQDYVEDLNSIDSELEELNQQLPKVCPLCGNSMKGSNQ